MYKPHAPHHSRRQAGFARTPWGRAWLKVGIVLIAAAAFWLWMWFSSATPSSNDQPADSATGPDAALQAMTPEQQIETLRQRLNNHIQQHESALPVIAQLRWYVKQHPKSVNAHNALGQALLYDRQHAQAYDAFVQSLALQENQPELHTLAGTLARQLNRPEAAEAHYRLAMQLEPKVVKHDQHLASLLQHQGRYDEAIEVLRRAAEVSPQRPKLWFQLAMAYRASDDIEQAQQAMRRAVEQSVLLPADQRRQMATAYADLLLEMDRPQETVAALGTLPREQQLHHDALQRFAEAFDRLNEPAQAAAMYEKAVIVTPTDEQAAAQAAYWYQQAGNTKRARAMTETLRQINPHSKHLEKLRGN